MSIIIIIIIIIIIFELKKLIIPEHFLWVFVYMGMFTQWLLFIYMLS